MGGDVLQRIQTCSTAPGLGYAIIIITHFPVIPIELFPRQDLLSPETPSLLGVSS